MADVEIASSIASVSVVEPLANEEFSIASSIAGVSAIATLVNMEWGITSEIDGVSLISARANEVYSIRSLILALSDVHALVTQDVGIEVAILAESFVSPAFARADYGTENVVPCNLVPFHRPQDSAGKCVKQCITNFKYVFGDDYEYECADGTRSFFFEAGSDISYEDAISNFLSGALALAEKLRSHCIDLPIANDFSVSIAENFNTLINILDQVTEGTVPLDPASLTIVSNVSHGTLVNNGDGTINYSPDLNYLGTDSFSYKISDQDGFESNVGVATLTVTAAVILRNSLNIGETFSITVISTQSYCVMYWDGSYQCYNSNDTANKIIATSGSKICYVFSTGTLQEIFVGSDKVFETDFSLVNTFNTIDLTENLLTSLDVSNNTNLTHLIFSTNQITSFDFTIFPLLIVLGFSENNTGNVDLSANTLIQILNCHTCGITSLDVSIFPQLTGLVCRNNSISTLNLLSNPNLQNLNCQTCNLGGSGLDISNNPSIISLVAINNSFSAAQVNDILIKLDGFGLSNGGCDLTVNSPPSGAGLVAKANLIGKGWTVVTD